ncbi:MAG: methylmalonyl-CoA mutase family protein [Actinobacteria bacterium]|nr:methylmalonyl-CoA mutase family protein [Actinomycetota bacterium]
MDEDRQKPRDKDQWLPAATAAGTVRDADFTTVSSAEVEALYRPSDLAGHDYDRDLGDPGDYPYTRGIHPMMYRGRLWTMRQFAGFGEAEDTNQRFRFLLEQGQTGLSLALDLPTLMGYDSDDLRSEGEVGRCGVAMDSVLDMERVFEGIPLDRVTTSMTTNAPAAILLAFYLVAAERQGVGFDQVGGTIQNDILKEYIAQNTYIFPPEPSLRLITDIFAFCADHVPRWNTISISGYHIREAGATAVQELAFTLANGFAYVDAGLEVGLDVDVFAPRLSFFFNAHIDLFEEVAKYRAARRIWARHMRERYGAKDQRSWLMRFHTQTAGCSLTAQQPDNNIVRTAIEALASILGGTQSLHTNSLDEVLALPTERAVEIALRTQQVLAYETGVANVVDPLGGSYYVEALTDRMEEEAEEYFRKIDALGGVVAAIDKSFFQKEIAEASFRYQMQVERGDKVVVGVNKFATGGPPRVETLRIDPALEARQVERLRELRVGRDQAAADKALSDLLAACTGGENVMPVLLDCARAFCTLGEMVATMKTVFGVYRETPVF